MGKWNPRFISSLNKAKETPLHWASAKGKTPMVKLLLEMGAWRLCDSQSDEGWTPLHHAAANGHFHTVEVLVQRGTKINTQNNKGNTPLHIASSNGQAGIVDYLVKRGARADIPNNEGRTASGSGKSEAVASLMEAEGGARGSGAGGGVQEGLVRGGTPPRGDEAWQPRLGVGEPLRTVPSSGRRSPRRRSAWTTRAMRKTGTRCRSG